MKLFTYSTKNVIFVNKMIAFIKHMNIIMNHFPKHEKYALCTEIRNCSYNCYLIFVESTKRFKNKDVSFGKLDIEHEKLRMLIKLAYELGYFKYRHQSSTNIEVDSNRRYLYVNALVDELGALIGTMMKSS